MIAQAKVFNVMNIIMINIMLFHSQIDDCIFLNLQVFIELYQNQMR